jgi:predicted transcriptional regulator
MHQAFSVRFLARVMLVRHRGSFENEREHFILPTFDSNLDEDAIRFCRRTYLTPQRYLSEVHDTSIDTASKSSTDDTIMEYLSKKSVVDQTEKLVLARIGTKLGISSEQAETGVKSLSAKNLIRKTYFQGRVGYEITPKGKAAIEALAKAETARVTKQLQESIHQERIAKVRSSTIKKILSAVDDWKSIQLPDKNLIEETAQEATKFLLIATEAEAKRPFCHILHESYNQEFSGYKAKIEELIEQSRGMVRTVNNFAKIKDYLELVSKDVDSINRAIRKYEPIAEAEAQVNQLRIGLAILKSTQYQLQTFDTETLARFQDLKAQLADCSRILEGLKRPTHEFASIKKESSTENTVMYSDPECPIKYSYDKSGQPSLEKCSKCGIKRKSIPINIG